MSPGPKTVSCKTVKCSRRAAESTHIHITSFKQQALTKNLSFINYRESRVFCTVLRFIRLLGLQKCTICINILLK